jgi:sugar phosphate permease
LSGETNTRGAERVSLAPAVADAPVLARSGESAVIWTLWLTYGAFYFCRTNLSAAVPGMTAAASAGGLGLSNAEVGWILASLKVAYGLGQALNGQLSERFPPRVMLALGMFGSAGLNVLFGLSAGFYFLLFVWAMNGFAQSLGWTPCVRVAANWVPISRRGHAIGIIGTGYQITQGLTYLVAAQAAQHLGWRGALYVPAVLLSVAGLVMLFCLREAPDDDSDEDSQADQFRPASQTRLSFRESVYWTMYNPVLWLLGIALALLNACRYGFVDWGIAHLMKARDIQVGKAGLNFFVIAIGATAGSYLAGWATDRFFGSRRAPMICMLMLLLGVLTLSYDAVVRSSVPGTMAMLVIIGFCIYGPQVLLVGTAPADLAHRGTSAAAAGFVNFMGYMGAAGGDIVTGYYSADEHGGWQVAIFIWAGWAFAGAAVTGLLWNATSRRLTVLPAFVPRVIALLAMSAAGALLLADGQLPILAALACAAAVCLLGTGVSRWAAVPALAVALPGLVTIFATHLVTKADLGWQQTTTVLAFGLAAVAALMILIEPGGEPCESSSSGPDAVGG